MTFTPHPIIALLFLPGGLFLLVGSLFYEWVDRKLVAQFQNRIGHILMSTSRLVWTQPRRRSWQI